MQARYLLPHLHCRQARNLFSIFRLGVTDGRAYRRTVYTFSEIADIIELYGLPSDWNSDGAFDPERYVKVQVWDEGPILRSMGETP